MARVFVSYSHDSDAHRRRVLGLAHRLLEAGHEVVLDRFTGAPVEGWPRWMARQIREADRVVCVCTPTYRRRFEGEEARGGLGVSWEGYLLTTELYRQRGRSERVVPVYPDRVGDVPFVLRAHDPIALEENGSCGGVVARLGGVVGESRPPPEATAGMERVWTLGRLVDPIFRVPRPFRGVEGYLPSQLLRPEHAIVPFVGRGDLVAELDAWCAGGGARVRVVHGQGGAGKTRLALETAARRATEGWRAGPLAWRHLSDEALDELFDDPIPLLLVVDYAETRPAEVAQVLRRLGERQDTTNVRVLLLARGLGDWWRRLTEEVRELEGLASGDDPIEVVGFDDAGEHLRAAADAFAGWLNRERVGELGNRGGSALEQQVAALVAVLGGGAEGWEGLRTHETGYLRSAGAAGGIAREVVDLFPEVMALITLAGGVSANEAPEWLGVVDGMQDLTAARRRGALKVLAALHPRVGGGIDGVRPDRVGEALVASEDPEGALARAAVDRGRGNTALTVLTRLAAAGDDGPLRRIVRERRDVLVEAVIEVARETGDPVGRVMAEELERRPDKVVAERVVGLVPGQTVALRELAVVALRVMAEEEGDEVRKAEYRHDLSTALAGVGRGEEALAAIESAVETFRRRGEARDNTESVRLALSLQALSNRRAGMGMLREALEAAKEAVDVWLRLVQNDRREYEPHLAIARGTLSQRLLDLGLGDRAYDESRAAVNALSPLALADPNSLGPVHTALLNNHFTCLSKLGRREEALRTIRKVVHTYATLANQRTDAFTPNHATALRNLSHALRQVGNDQEALDAIDQAVAILRRLAELRPRVFWPHLAGSLTAQASCLATLDRHEEALRASTESVGLWEELAGRRGAELRQESALALHIWSNCLATAGERTLALQAVMDAVRAYRQLVALHPGSHEVQLASTLDSQARRLWELGRDEEARAAIAESVSLARQVHAVSPDAASADLALALWTSATLQLPSDPRASVQAAQESLSLYAPLALRFPRQFAGDHRSVHAHYLQACAAAGLDPDPDLFPPG